MSIPWGHIKLLIDKCSDDPEKAFVPSSGKDGLSWLRNPGETLESDSLQTGICQPNQVFFSYMQMKDRWDLAPPYISYSLASRTG